MYLLQISKSPCSKKNTYDSLIPPWPGSHVACRLVSQRCVMLLTKLSTLHSRVNYNKTAHICARTAKTNTHKLVQQIIFNDMKQDWYTHFFPILAPGCQVVMRKLSGYGNLQLPTPGSQRWITSTHNVANKTKSKSIRKGYKKKEKKTMMKTSSLWKIHPIKVREKNVFFFCPVFSSSFSSSLSVSPESDSTSPAAIRRLSLLSPKHTKASGGRNPFSGFHLVDMAGRKKR